MNNMMDHNTRLDGRNRKFDLVMILTATVPEVLDILEIGSENLTFENFNCYCNRNKEEYYSIQQVQSNCNNAQVVVTQSSVQRLEEYSPV